ncbi:hypothetical protein A8H37_28705 [Burkholderia thailandensis]|nr:hypothetical protein A8H37_28705 [Burkholderia thailandensis]
MGRPGRRTRNPQRTPRVFYARAARDAVGAAHRPSPDRMRRARRFRTHDARARRYTVTTILPNCSFDSR